MFIVTLYIHAYNIKCWGQSSYLVGHRSGLFTFAYYQLVKKKKFGFLIRESERLSHSIFVWKNIFSLVKLTSFDRFFKSFLSMTNMLFEMKVFFFTFLVFYSFSCTTIYRIWLYNANLNGDVIIWSEEKKFSNIIIAKQVVFTLAIGCFKKYVCPYHEPNLTPAIDIHPCNSFISFISYIQLRLLKSFFFRNKIIQQKKFWINIL